MREEIGIAVEIERLTGVYYEARPEGGDDMHHFVFACRPGDGTAPRPTSREILECGFFARAALPRPISDFTLRRIDDALAGAPPCVVSIGPRRWLE